MSEQYIPPRNDFSEWEDEVFDIEIGARFDLLNKIVQTRADLLDLSDKPMLRQEKAKFCEDASKEVRAMAAHLGFQDSWIATYGQGWFMALGQNNNPYEQRLRKGEKLIGRIVEFEVWQVPSLKMIQENEENKIVSKQEMIFSPVAMLKGPRYFIDRKENGIYRNAHHILGETAVLPLVYKMPTITLDSPPKPGEQ